jgi:hypothetical protein
LPFEPSSLSTRCNLRDLYRFIDGRTDRTDEEREGGREEREREREREREKGRRRRPGKVTYLETDTMAQRRFEDSNRVVCDLFNYGTIRQEITFCC